MIDTVGACGSWRCAIGSPGSGQGALLDPHRRHLTVEIRLADRVRGRVLVVLGAVRAGDEPQREQVAAGTDELQAAVGARVGAAATVLPELRADPDRVVPEPDAVL